MKKSLLALAAGVMLSAASAEATTVYFDNSKTNWPGVYTWEFGGPGSDFGGTTTQVEIDGHTLYQVDTNYAKIIFRGENGWGKGQTDDIEIANGVDNAVYAGGQGNTSKVATIVDGKWVATGGGEEVTDHPIYIRGSFTGTWSLQDEYKFTKGDDGLYTITTTIYAGGSFKIFQGAWATSWGGPSNGNNDDTNTLQKIEAGQTYTLTQDGENSKNLYVPANLVNVTFTFNPETAELKLSNGEEVELPEKKWFVAWDFDGAPEGESWSFNHEMEKQEEGTYKYVVDNTDSASTDNYFAVFRGDSCTGWNDNNNTRYQPKGVQGDQTVEADTTYDMQEGNSSTWKLGKNGIWTVVVDPRDPNNMTIHFDLGDSTGEANVLIDRAADGDNPDTYESYAMTAVEGEQHAYTWSGTIEEGDKLKFNIHGVDYTYDPAVGTITSDDHDANVTMEYVLTEGEGMVEFDYAVGEVTFVVDVDDAKVTMTYKDAPDVTLTVTEGENSTIHRVYKKADDYYQTSHTLSFTEAESVDIRVHSTRYVPDYTQGDELTNGYRYPLTVLADDEAAPAYGGETGIEYYVTVATGDTNYVFFTTDMETAVSEIAAENGEAVYFNMQGIRVANPENGLYIVVKDGKAVKTIK